MVGKTKEWRRNRFPRFGNPANQTHPNPPRPPATPPMEGISGKSPFHRNPLLRRGARSAGWVLPALMIALCNAASADTLFSEGFEGSFPPAGWTQNSVDQSTTYERTDSYSARFTAVSDSFISPPLTNAQTLTFWSYATTATPTVNVERSTNVSGPWTAVPGSPFSNTGGQWTEQTVTLASSETLYIRFSKSGSGYIYIDDVLVENSGTPANNPPVLSSIGNQSVTVSNALSFAVTATDTDTDPIILSVSNLPPGAVFNTVTNAGTVSNNFNWAVAAPTGTYTTTFYADDGTTNDFETITITVTNIPAISNQPPVLATIGNKEVFELDTLSFAVTASDPIDSDPITLTATNLPSGAIFTNGVFTWSNAAPDGVYSVTFIATDKDGSDNEIISITIKERPVLMITEVADPAGTGGGDYRFVELYNAGTAPIILDAGQWFLSKQINGGPTWTDTILSGTLPAGATLVVAYSATKFQEAYGFAPDQSSSSINGTGNDAYFLYTGGDHTSGTLVDIYGALDTDGTGEPWDYKDSRAMRNATASGPNTIWTASEWVITTAATTEYMNPGAAYNVPPFLLPIGSKGGMEGRSITFSVTAEDLADNDPITLSATNLPPGATFTNGMFTWDVAAPVGSYDVTFKATDKDGDDSETVTMTIIAQPLLLISEIADPDVPDAEDFRFVEIYNAGTNATDFSANAWHLSRQNNGSSWYDVELTGTIPAAGTWVVANSGDDFQTAYGFAPDHEDSAIAGNGNDVYALFYGGNHEAGILIDIYGELDTDGTDTEWEYENSRAERNDGVLEPNTEWTAAEWTLQSGATTNSMTPGQHGPLPEITLPDSLFIFSGDSFDFSVSASNRIDTTDLITLAATTLPAGATFAEGTGIGGVSGQFAWNEPADGAYPVVFTASGKNGVTEQNEILTVSDHSPLNEWFYRWKGRDKIYELDNGQFWQQISSEIYGNYGLYHPDAYIEKQSSTYRMTLPGVIGSVEVKQLLNTVETRINGTFGGYAEGSIVKLQNGTWWRQTSTERSTRNDYQPDALIWQNDDTFEMFIEGEDDPITVEQLTITESDVTGLYTRFSMARNTIYPLADGTVWKQTSSSDSTSTDDTDVTAWRWVEDGSTWIRFVDSSNLEIGTCRVETEGAPANPATISRIDGYFRGWKGQRVFALQNGEYWQQTTPTTVEQTLYNPQVIITNILATGTYEMRVENALPPATVEVEQLTDVTRLEIEGWFHGFQSGNFLHLSDNTWWRQTSSEIVAYSRYQPEILLYGGNQFEMQNLGTAIEAERLNVQSESTVVSKFIGLAYGNIYTLQNLNTWQQLSKERTRTAHDQPSTMLWLEDNRTHLLLRGDLDVTIGTCTVADPEADTDGDMMSNAAEIVAGTDLFDEESTFKVTETTRDGTGHYVLHWDAVEDRVYTIDWTPSLTESFQALETNIFWPKNSWTDTVHTVEAKGFYRITVRLAD